jgi:FXSXX-COOH protein
LLSGKELFRQGAVPASKELFRQELGEVAVDGATHTTGTTPEWRSAMLDVSGLSLRELTSGAAADPAGDSPLAHCLRRLADDLAHPGEPIAGFNSAL